MAKFKHYYYRSCTGLCFYLPVSFNICGTWSPDYINKERQGLGRKLVARLYHVWCDLHLLECLVARISKGVSADQKVKGKDGNKDKQGAFYWSYVKRTSRQYFDVRYVLPFLSFFFRQAKMEISPLSPSCVSGSKYRRTVFLKFLLC